MVGPRGGELLVIGGVRLILCSRLELGFNVGHEKSFESAGAAGGTPPATICYTRVRDPNSSVTL